MRPVVSMCVLAIAALAAAPAGGDTFFVGGGDGFRIIEQVSAPVTATGEVAVDFQGPGEAGTVVWRPPRTASFDVARYRTRHARGVTGALFFSPVSDAALTSAQVRRTDPDGTVHTCTDAASSEYADLDVRSTTSSVRLALAGSDADVVTTRCAGPLPRDVAAALPAATVPYASVRHGRRTIDLSGTRPFAAGGLTGTVRSTLVLKLGPARRTRSPRNARPPQVRFTRRRRLDVEYKVEQLGGTLAADVAGVADPLVCGALDTCGLGGTLTLTPAATHGEVILFADAPTARSGRALRAAFGLGGGAPAPGVRPIGSGAASGRAGALAVALQRETGGCSDTVPLTHGDLSLRISGGRLRVGYLNGDEGARADPLRSRCPGPTLADVVGDRAVATGSVPLSALRAPRVTIRLTRGASFSAAGWTGRTRPDLTLVLRRGRVRESVTRQPRLPVGG